MRKQMLNLSLILLTVIVVAFSVWGPEELSDYKDKGILNKIQIREETAEEAGYRYRLSRSEKLYILSRSLNNQVIPESEQSALTRETDVEYADLTGTYAFVINHKGPSEQEITDEEIYAITNEGINHLKKLGILPDTIKEVNASSYEALLYSAIDVPEPRNNVAVWKVSLAGSIQNAKKENRLIDACIDADDGKIYEFYVRTELEWKDIDTDALVEKWSSYMGLEKPEEYETDNPLLETTPYYKKYIFTGIGDERTIVTVGFYEGINELFLKISK